MGPWKPIGDGEWVGTDTSDRFPIYTRANAGEVYPEVYRPLSFSIAQEAGERAMRNAMLVTGFIRPKQASRFAAARTTKNDRASGGRRLIDSPRMMPDENGPFAPAF